jgi:4-oxalocrotonate tautomerase
MPYVNVRLIDDGATDEQKSAVIKGITDVLVNVLNKSPDATFVVIDEVPAENWGFKGKSVAEQRKE